MATPVLSGQLSRRCARRRSDAYASTDAAGGIRCHDDGDKCHFNIRNPPYWGPKPRSLRSPGPRWSGGCGFAPHESRTTITADPNYRSRRASSHAERIEP
jgi:hypothetical protein